MLVGVDVLATQKVASSAASIRALHCPRAGGTADRLAPPPLYWRFSPTEVSRQGSEAPWPTWCWSCRWTSHLRGLHGMTGTKGGGVPPKGPTGRRHLWLPFRASLHRDHVTAAAVDDLPARRSVARPAGTRTRSSSARGRRTHAVRNHVGRCITVVCSHALFLRLVATNGRRQKGRTGPQNLGEQRYEAGRSTGTAMAEAGAGRGQRAGFQRDGCSACVFGRGEAGGWAVIMQPVCETRQRELGAAAVVTLPVVFDRGSLVRRGRLRYYVYVASSHVVGPARRSDWDAGP